MTPEPNSWQAIGTIATLLGTVLTLFVSWIRERTASARRVQAINEAKQYVDFWKAYMETAASLLAEDDMASLSRLYTRNLKLLGEYIEYEVTQPIRDVVSDVPLRWIRRETLKQQAKRAVRTWGIVTPIVFLLLWGTSHFVASPDRVLLRVTRLWEAPSSYLEVKSDPPGAEVSIDGLSVGMTNLMVRLSPGTHKVVSRMNGRVEEKIVELKKDEYVQVMAFPSPP
jgi:sulfur relay (sulfurtransferase) DsrC/TusE family protein